MPKPRSKTASLGGRFVNASLPGAGALLGGTQTARVQPVAPPVNGRPIRKTIRGWDGRDYPIKDGTYASIRVVGKGNMIVQRVRVTKEMNKARMLTDFLTRNKITGYLVRGDGTAINGDGCVLMVEEA